jgi:uncharacterized protein DUF2844
MRHELEGCLRGPIVHVVNLQAMERFSRGVPMKTTVVVLVVLAICMGVWGSAGSASATLGQSEDSVFADQYSMHAQMRTMANEGYVVQQIEAPDGTIVREYVSPTGTVFGVTWQGLKIPNLTQLLGAYFAVYQAALQPPVRRRGPVVVHTASLVVEMYGHMRSFSGLAYLPSLVPPDLSPEVIQ